MKRPGFPLAVVAVLIGSAGAALASTSTPPLERHASRGFALGGVVATDSVQGVSVHGDVCRVSQSAVRPVAVRLERLNAQGATMAAQTTPLSGALSARSRGCAFYTARADWRIGPGESLRISTLTAPELTR